MVTKDELVCEEDISFELTVDGITRQKSTTRQLIFDIPRLIELASFQMTLYPGDIISTGTPDGVGPIVPGNVVSLTVEGIGTLSVTVAHAHPGTRRGLGN